MSFIRPRPHLFLHSLHTSPPPPPPAAAAARVQLAYELHHHHRQPPRISSSSSPSTSPILFLHGFLGSKRENRTISRQALPSRLGQLAKDTSRSVYALDLRNHGDSGHHPKHDYVELALDVRSFIEKHRIREPTIIGHSMGAKTALTLALESPHLIKDVVAIDNGPIHLPLKSDFLGYLQGLARLQEERITSHRQADEILAAYEKDPAIRLWLISNLVKKPNSPYLDLRIPVEILKTAMGPLGNFPYRETQEEGGCRQFHGRLLFLRALRSHYIPETAFPTIFSFFPASKIVNIDSGHWIVQEKPEELRQSTFVLPLPNLSLVIIAWSRMRDTDA
ncbi:putative alpha/beta hydrolase [Aspergillus brunneoviolaceus CBS 621.78]|uniref:Alpha/beta hydrolase n=1 Tax=Aspergillus brunneoviolaceus CBS 621.78 TaxID=1450534 RepID=A0ACD1G9Z2_9EURO|nr:alpha/beta hydrolase [Aspergillus brunneoviolaceus CBS 621.78]RAH46063.1 alpha/beta hydrolase [Aspergillus brunneoviolaceus CBS 621.78]